MSDTNRRFSNELAAFKSGENVDHNEPDVIISVSKKSKSSFIKLFLILIVLILSGYFLIRKPLGNEQIQSAIKKVTNTSISSDEYAKSLINIDSSLINKKALIARLYESNVSAQTIQQLTSAGITNIDQADFYIKAEKLIQTKAVKEVSTISQFLQNYDVDSFLKAVEAKADLDYLNQLKKDARFAILTSNDLLTLALVDKNFIILKLAKTKRTNEFSLLQWQQIAETFPDTNYVEAILKADKNRELELDSIIELFKKDIPLNTVLNSIENGDIKSKLTQWTSK